VRAGDVERAALREEVHAAAVERRFDAERHADRLARRAREPEGPDRQVNRRRANAGHLGNQRHDLVERGDLAAREDVRAAGGSRRLTAQPEPVNQIVNVGEMVVDLPVSQDRKATEHVSKQLEQTPIAGPIDAARPGDHQLHTTPIRGLSRQLLAFELRDLVDVARFERCVFVCRGMVHVAVDANRAAVHHSSNAGSGRGFDEMADGGAVHRAVGLGRDARRTVNRRDVVHDVDAGDRRFEGRAIAQVARRQLDPGGCQLVRRGLIAHQGTHLARLVRCLCQCSRQMAAGKAGGARYEDRMRSAQTVTGDPRSRSRPSRSSTCSDLVVKRRDPMILWSWIGITNCRCTERVRNCRPPSAFAIVPARNTR
jgi:hypothetical protein